MPRETSVNLAILIVLSALRRPAVANGGKDVSLVSTTPSTRLFVAIQTMMALTIKPKRGEARQQIVRTRMERLARF